MLKELYIRNLGIVDELNVPFGPGLNVISGETGAGKSLIARAVSLVLGAKMQGELVRTGAKEAEVHATIGLSREAKSRLKELGFSPGLEVSVRRLMPLKGRSRTFLDGKPVTGKLVSNALDGVIGLFGQHAQKELVSPETHRDILDSYGGLSPRLERYREGFEEFRAAAGKVEELRAKSALASEKRELIKFQVGEIAAAGISPGEDAALEDERGLLMNVERLTRGIGECLGLLYESKGASLELVGEAQRTVEELARVDKRLGRSLKELKSIGADLEEVYSGLRDYASRLEPDPARLEEVEDRLHLLGRLKKKYGPGLEDVLVFHERAARELSGFESLAGDIEDAQEKKRSLLQDALKRGKGLTKARHKCAQKLEKDAKKGLSLLGLEGARFEVRVSAPEEPVEESLTESGLDTVEFFFSANPKEELRPLGIVASGGELSRLFLSLMSAVAGALSPETLVFDEVDIGVGGGSARMVGRKLKSISRGRQIICITHLPQIASCGESHLLVSKVKKRGRNVVAVKSLSTEERIEEVARMLAGDSITAASLDQARALLDEDRA